MRNILNSNMFISYEHDCFKSTDAVEYEKRYILFSLKGISPKKFNIC